MNVPELKTAAEIAADLRGAAPDTDDDPRDAKAYTFDFSHTDPRGKVWSGKFTNRILTIRQRRLMKVTKAQMAEGVPMTALDADIWETNEMVAHLAVSLDAKAPGFPEWAKRLEDLYDEAIIVKLYSEVASHEARFHRRGPAAAASEDAAEDGGGTA